MHKDNALWWKMLYWSIYLYICCQKGGGQNNPGYIAPPPKQSDSKQTYGSLPEYYLASQISVILAGYIMYNSYSFMKDLDYNIELGTNDPEYINVTPQISDPA